MAHLLIQPVGSHGDVHPFLAFGSEMKMRGHRVTILVSPKFDADVRHAGLEMVPLGTVEDYDQFLKSIEKMDTRHALKIIFEGLASHIPDVLSEIQRLFHDSEEEVVLVGSSLGFASRIARELYGIPLITGHLAPSTTRSARDVPLMEPDMWWLRHCPSFIVRGFYRLADLMIDRKMGAGLQAQLKAHGLPPAKSVVGQWWHSPDSVLAFWPEWFGAKQTDHPRQMETIGFAYYREDNAPDLGVELIRWIDGGEPPIVFAPGSANAIANEFFAKAVEICRAAGKRGLLMTKYPEQLPEKLPDFIRHEPYAPFARLLPRCGAIVHHGGIGTTAQSIAAEIPQLVTPMAFDQFDNAARTERLGLGKVANLQWPAEKIAQALKGAISGFDRAHSAEYAARVRRGADWDRVEEVVARLARS